MEGAGTLETEGTGTLELILTDVKGLSIITERRSSLLSSLQAWKLSVKMQISVADFEKKRIKSMGKEIRGTKSKINMIHTNKKQGAQIQLSTEYPQNN